MTDIWIAFSFLTILPFPISRVSVERMARAIRFFPVVGGVLGVFLALVAWGMGFFLPSNIGAVLLLTLWVVFTGALHLDGFLDACDGLFGGSTPEARLNIMRDERVGAFALAGGVLLLLTKYASLVNILSVAGVGRPSGPMLVPLALPLVLSPLLGRFAMAYGIVYYPYARPQGLGLVMKQHSRPTDVYIAGGISLAVVSGLMGFSGIALFGGVIIFTRLMAWFVLHRIPGLTGDIYGAMCELVETVVLLLWSCCL